MDAYDLPSSYTTLRHHRSSRSPSALSSASAYAAPPPRPSSASRLHQQALHTSTLRKSRSIPVHLTVAGEEESSALPFRLRPEAYRGYTEHDPDCELIQEVSSNLPPSREAPVEAP